MQLLLGASIAVVSLILGAVFRPYLKGYAEKKGENLATHEDIQKLVDQVKAVTEATKKIEAEISSGLWYRQKRWEMKREVLFEVAKRISVVEDSMLRVAILFKQDSNKQKEWETHEPSTDEQRDWNETKHERLRRWMKTKSEFEVSSAFVFIVCSKEAAEAIRNLGTFIIRLAARMTTIPDAYDSGQTELVKKILLARQAIRKELEVDA